ncbi:hypothetical protein UCRPA7_1568 [Phaeoacremonium minimum UCRPA7]|uniref:Uncharacterized protein n=1 Tax=Phaeoacremonium minimum (strain UCR-PA7) TaxID=1286976 RepID=R8BU68_PHAM7|nr:hypothetical protein UCRPA7_1568 [Phaeoacremonium minimum UCRPA7]EOO02922.1 hypothetical protein UCRPA7_1568 [Phaeoacremonium minimum UCRPA7]
MRFINYLRRKFKRKGKQAQQPQTQPQPQSAPISEEPLLVDYPPTERRDGWQSVDSREGSQSGHEGDWSGHLHQRAPTPPVPAQDASTGAIAQTWGVFKEYMIKLLNTDPRSVPSRVTSRLRRQD